MRTLMVGVLAAAAVMCTGAVSVSGHEFWIAPERYIVRPGTKVVARLAVGLMMKGVSLPYISRDIRSFTITTRNGTRDVTAAEGDDPALVYTPTERGLQVIAHHTMPKKVKFDSWDKFVQYLAYEGLERIVQAHRARGLPESGFSEAYTRCAKALIQVGRVDPRDHDEPLGLPLELIADGNPYRPGTDALIVTLRRQGKPLAGHPVAVFHYDRDVSRRLQYTDPRGQIRISLAGGGAFLLNAVDLRPVENADYVWASRWATLAFALPFGK